MQSRNLSFVIWPCHIVCLNEVHSPFGVLGNHRVVVGLCTLLGHIQAVHVRIPVTKALLVGDIRGMLSATQNRDVLCYGLPGNTAEDERRVGKEGRSRWSP